MTIEAVVDRFVDLIGDRSGRFDEMAGAVFAFQRAENPAYSRYCGQLLSDRQNHSEFAPHRAPFLPVEAFKRAAVTTFEPAEADAVFVSSATGQRGRSRHYVRDVRIYERAITAGFRHAFGSEPWRLVAHLPEYATDSSLVYMVGHLIETFGAEGSGFMLHNTEPLEAAIEATLHDGNRLMLFGAAFGLLDLVAERRFKLPAGAVVLETGGMKTHRREISRFDLHALLAEGFGVPRDHVLSEYGMCELMSQCYTRGGETFIPPPWMRAYVVDPSDPAREVPHGRSGVLAIVDLANLYSCSFVLTEDRAVQLPDGFEILGRITDAELRGCNFLLENV